MPQQQRGGLSCGTTVRGPRHAADHFRALRCLSVVWKHKHDITSCLAQYPFIKHILSLFYFTNKSLFCCFNLISSIFSCSSPSLLCSPSLLTLPSLPLLVLHSVPLRVTACLLRFSGKIIKWLIQLRHVISGKNWF